MGLPAAMPAKLKNRRRLGMMRNTSGGSVAERLALISQAVTDQAERRKVFEMAKSLQVRVIRFEMPKGKIRQALEFLERFQIRIGHGVAEGIAAEECHPGKVLERGEIRERDVRPVESEEVEMK